MYKLFFITLFSLSLFANENTVAETEELLKYSSLNINDTISVYAAEIYMNQEEDENSYSVGLLLNAETKGDAEFGVGYVKATEDTTSLTHIVRPIDKEADDGVLFFMNYKF